MVETEWKISKSAAQCSACGATLVPAQESYSALFQTPEGFRRQDYCAACFNPRPADMFYFWKNGPGRGTDTAPAKPRLFLDVVHVLEFFKRLDGENSGQKQAFRYILALMLARKKILSVAHEGVSDGVRYSIWKEKGTNQEHRVVEPELNPAELLAVTGELSLLLGTAPQDAPGPDLHTAAGSDGHEAAP